MTEAEFSSAMKVLTADFGETEYTPMRRKLIFDHCKDLPLRNFKQIIMHFMETKSIRYPPLPNEFRDQALIQKKGLHQKDERAAVTTLNEELANTGQALKDLLKQFGAKNLNEVICKTRVRK